MQSRGEAELALQKFQPSHRTLPGARFHCGTVERELESSRHKFMDKVAIGFVLKRLPGEKYPTSFRAIHWPDGLSGSQTTVVKIVIDRLDVFHRCIIGIVKNGKAKPFAARKIHLPLPHNRAIRPSDMAR